MSVRRHADSIYHPYHATRGSEVAKRKKLFQPEYRWTGDSGRGWKNGIFLLLPQILKSKATMQAIFL